MRVGRWNSVGTHKSLVDDTLIALVAPINAPQRRVTMTKPRRSWNIMQAAGEAGKPMGARQRDANECGGLGLAA